jgi:hypothetical protein
MRQPVRNPPACIAGSKVLDFGGAHPAVLSRGYANVQETQFERNGGDGTTPAVFADSLGACALEATEFVAPRGSSGSAIPLGAPPAGDAIFFADDTSLRVALTSGLAEPEWVVDAATTQPVQPLDAMPEDVRAKMISTDDDWFKAVSKVRSACITRRPSLCSRTRVSLHWAACSDSSLHGACCNVSLRCVLGDAARVCLMHA